MSQAETKIKRLFSDGPGRYLVIKTGGDAPTHPHHSRIRATREAERLAALHPGEIFTVAKIKEVITVEVPATISEIADRYDVPITEAAIEMQTGDEVVITSGPHNGELGVIAFAAGDSPNTYYVDIPTVSQLERLTGDQLEYEQERSLPVAVQKYTIGTRVKTSLGIGTVYELLNPDVHGKTDGKSHDCLIKMEHTNKIVRVPASQIFVIEFETA